MPQRRWQLVEAWKQKRQGQVWVVEEQGGKRGYFKFASKRQWYFSGPMIANEYVAAALAKRLALPVADLEMAVVAGPDGREQRGIVSVAALADEVLTWHDAPLHVKEHPEEFVRNPSLLAATVVFDAWIANIDRAAGKNLILYRDHPEDLYDWYLIDHGHCLYGSPRKWKRGAWNAPIWQQLWRYYHVPKGLLRLQSSLKQLERMIVKIEGLTAGDIEAALNSVPRGELREQERQFMKRLLLHRQQHLRSMLARWIAYKGIKEYR